MDKKYIEYLEDLTEKRLTALKNDIEETIKMLIGMYAESKFITYLGFIKESMSENTKEMEEKIISE